MFRLSGGARLPPDVCQKSLISVPNGDQRAYAIPLPSTLTRRFDVGSTPSIRTVHADGSEALLSEPVTRNNGKRAGVRAAENGPAAETHHAPCANAEGCAEIAPRAAGDEQKVRRRIEALYDFQRALIEGCEHIERAFRLAGHYSMSATSFSKREACASR